MHSTTQHVPHTFKVVENALALEDTQQGLLQDGISLNGDQQQYLLPHFLMLLVGKPGSGKTTIMKQMITNPQLYRKKFDKIMVISPSFNKTGIQLERRYVTEQFDLDWIYQHISNINQDQINKIFGHDKGARNMPQEYRIRTGAKAKTISKSSVMGDTKSRFVTADMLRSKGVTKIGGSAPIYSQVDMDDRAQMDQLYKQFKEMPVELQKHTHANVLLVLDDVVAEIKRNENNPRLAALVMNRRHLVFNGTLSIIMVTQKYTLIPSRFRSNANWLILFQLNPLDFESVFRDVVVEDRKTWAEILNFVFGRSLVGEGKKAGSKKDEEEEKEKPQTADELAQQRGQAKGIARLPLTVAKKNPYEEEIKFTEQQQEHVKNYRAGKSGSSTTQNSQDVMKSLKSKKYDNIGIWVEYNVMFKNFKRIEFQ